MRHEFYVKGAAMHLRNAGQSLPFTTSEIFKKSFSAGIYLFKVNDGNTRTTLQCVKSAQSLQ